MNKLLVLALVACTAAPAFAQQGASPFDMGTERRDRGIQDTQPSPPAAAPVPVNPVPVAPVRPAPTSQAPAPASTPPLARPATPPVQQNTPAQWSAQPPIPGLAPASSQAAPVSGAVDQTRRYLLPFGDMRLNGEIEQRSWSFYLTADQAGRTAKLHVAYQNSIFVAPETSKLTITINDVVVAAETIASAEQPAERVFEIPAGLLKAGGNMVRFGTNQRHRTDCTVESTYELWTDVDPSKTYLSFDGANDRRLGTLDDLRAIGVDGKGNTRFRIIAPALDQLGATDTLMRLSQGLALLAGMPNQSFTFSRQADGEIQPGEVAVFIGTTDELRTVVPNLAASSNSAAASFVDYPRSNGVSSLVLSGPNWPSIDGLVDSFVASLDGRSTQRLNVLSTESWRGMDTPLLFSDTVLDFAALGVGSQEFTGRLFRTSFTIGVPADFYANAYGEARILLDAAYTPDVLPGSHLDIFVNGNIASTVPITSAGGAILRQLPIKLTLRHFRPGVNTITVEAALRTAADASCAPGASSEEKPRFAIFGTSQFHMPDFARIAQVPNVAATAGIGFPYFMGQEPVSLFLGRIDEPTLSAAATFAGKIASASHRVIPLNVTMSAARMAERNAIFVGGISEMPLNVLSQLKIDQDSRNSWSPDITPQTVTQPSISLQDWQQRADGNFFSRQFEELSGWAKDNYDLSLSALRFAPPTDELYKPPKTAHLLVAQESDPTGQGTWTAVLAPDSAQLNDGMKDISTREEWEKMSGRIAIYSGAEEEMGSVPVSWFRFMPTQELSFANARLITANWLSDNIMSYALLLAAGSVLLGLATGGLLSLLGRR
ncbi:cellulose biosynthesis cyclic di-GMP-binding regulatory protein BcsB [Rhizobium wenxiniae]|uniref:cellulose biosynthesis cyclic di-GMP-binding regulatory protein BcsB n=1 Tax=Rhizobium wenxiniae TaxID=1737357 RepID=UPI001C6F4950|nr:cellulose biosynthesis cyclic di-GMP-binding regulatory protein BcsB [Rhizobium wenxiniae]MBW9090111.1 cellulose biosynthesis cyclic di-GMP-binding regulatory protein BcsB [Rhizobium wenxiniae]